MTTRSAAASFGEKCAQVVSQPSMQTRFSGRVYACTHVARAHTYVRTYVSRYNGGILAKLRKTDNTYFIISDYIIVPTRVTQVVTRLRSLKGLERNLEIAAERVRFIAISRWPGMPLLNICFRRDNRIAYLSVLLAACTLVNILFCF